MTVPLFSQHSVLSKFQKRQDIRLELINLWTAFFSGMPEDVVETEIRHIEDNITYLHDKGSRCGIGFTCVVAEEEWIVEPPDYMYLQYTTPFHIAAWCGYFHFFTLLHNQYPSVWSNYISFRNIIGDHPLHVCFFACDSWQTNISEMQSLSTLTRIDFTERNALGLAPLHIACIFNQLTGVRYLLSQHVEISYPVHFASNEDFSAVLEHIDQIRDLCNFQFSQHPSGTREDSCFCGSYDGSMSWGCMCSDPSFDDYHGCVPTAHDSSLLTYSGAEQSYALEHYTALHLALKCDAPRCAFELLQSVEDLLRSSDDALIPLQLISLHSMALFSFFSSDQSHTLFALLPKLWNQRHSLCNPSQDLLPFTILNAILSSNYLSAVRILTTQVNLSASCFSHTFSPLHIACILLNETLVRLLLGYGASVRELTLDGETCLHLIINSQSQPCSPTLRASLLGVLMMAGCDPQQPDSKGYTPLWYAVRQGDLSCVSVLIAYGANPAVCQDSVFGRNAFHEALRLRNEDMARLIVKAQPGLLNVPDAQGWYPLHYVIDNGNIQLMVYLLNHTTPLSDKAVSDMRVALQENHLALHPWVSVILPLLSKQIEVINVGEGGSCDA